MILRRRPRRTSSWQPCGIPGIAWQQVTAFHMDEYCGLASDVPEAFGRFLGERLFWRVRPGTVHYL